MPISSPNPTFDHLLELPRQDDSTKWLEMGFGEEITQVGTIDVNFKHLTLSSEYLLYGKTIVI